MKTQTALAKPYFVHPQALVESEDIGPGTRIWAFAHVLPGARIGAQCNVCDHVFIETGAVLEDNVFLGPNCVLTNDPNPRAYIKKSNPELQPTLIRANATVGANATILCGTTIGQYAFVGAGAVVLGPVLDFALMVGNPARQVGWMCSCARRLPIAASASVNSSTTCPQCGAQ